MHIEGKFRVSQRYLMGLDLGGGGIRCLLVDPDSGRTIWRGVTTQRLDHADAANYKRIPRVVARLLRKYPGA